MRYLVIFLLLFNISLGFAQNSKDDLKQQQSALKQQRKTVGAITIQEKKLKERIKFTERNITKITIKIDKNEKILAITEDKMKTLNQELGILEVQNIETTSELNELLAEMWPILLSKNNVPQSFSSWAEADRYSMWMRELHKKLAIVQSKLLQQKEKIQQKKEELFPFRVAVEKQIDDGNALKEDLLRQKLSVVNDLRLVQNKKKTEQEELDQIIGTVQSLKFRIAQEEQEDREAKRKEAIRREREQIVRPEIKKNIKLTSAQTIESISAGQKSSGRFIWPARGLIIVKFAPQENPPQRGIGLSLPQGTIVKAAGSGLVVYNDQLRGMGKVVIIKHANNYYSIYSYLLETNVEVRKTIKSGDNVGVCGYYPAVKGTGLYFELRFGANVINPLTVLH